MNILKRNGSEVRFDKSKIVIAISKANEEVEPHERLPISRIEAIANDIEADCAHLGYEVSVEDVQDMVEKQILDSNAFTLAKTYMRYRQDHNIARGKQELYKRLLAIVEGDSEEATQENSNKNPVIASTQRDYMAGEVSRDITNTMLLPKDIVDAHNAGIIHFHDADYYAQHMHNCFHCSEKLITSEGVVPFKSLKDGEQVQVLDLNGVWRTATVRQYKEPQSMQVVTFKAGRTVKKVICTKDHRWVLSNGAVTTRLKTGDTLAPLCDSVRANYPTDKDDAKAFCLGFILGDGTDTHYGTQVRLCGAKTCFANVFRLAGYSVTEPPSASGDLVAIHKGQMKQDFLDGRLWNLLGKSAKISLFLGLYAADGAKNCNKISTSDPRIVELIEQISGMAGYHITNKVIHTHNTNFKDNATLVDFQFMRYQNQNHLWKVVSIDTFHGGTEYLPWCVEEPVTHTFTLAGGMVTGNCDLINLEDMLQNGTVISGTLIEKPHSFSTACNIATQIIAQVASNQYGGQSISLSHLAPFVDVSRQKIRDSVMKELELAGAAPTQETIAEIVEMRLKDEIKRGIQTIQYQVVTLMTTNGQAPFITVFMYLDEVTDPQTKADLAMIIEETLRQRYQGVKNETGAWVTPAFPKLIYVLDEDNIHEDSPYWYLTVMAAKCTARRMVPDYISAKKMRELKGDVYTCMGCRSFLTPDHFTDAGVGNIANAGNYDPTKHKYYGRLTITLGRP